MTEFDQPDSNVADDVEPFEAFDDVDDLSVDDDGAEGLTPIAAVDLIEVEQPASAGEAQGSLFAKSTGDPRVDDAVSRLADLATSDITEHPAVLEDVHRRLHDALADLDR